jgi:hypothetical protein
MVAVKRWQVEPSAFVVTTSKAKKESGSYLVLLNTQAQDLASELEIIARHAYAAPAARNFYFLNLSCMR